MDKPRILFITPLPPPIHGSAMVSRYLQESVQLQEQYQTTFINLSTSRKMNEIGKRSIWKMIRFAGNAIEILPGAGITLENVERVVDITGCSQVHVARHKAVMDLSTTNNRSIYFGSALYPPEDRFDMTDGPYIAAVRSKLG